MACYVKAMVVSPERLAANLASVRAAIAEACTRAGRAPSDLRLVAVTKTEEPAVLPLLAAAGLREVGENRIEHLELMRAGAPADLRFHFIGRVQGRQLARIATACVALHSLCEADHIERLGRACAAAGRGPVVFLQVNTAGDSAKAGMAPEELPERLDLARRQGLEVVGLMTMAPLAASGGQADDATIRRCFAGLRELALRHGLPRLSMGMSHDYPLAIAEGGTDLRIGSRLFA